MVTLTGWPPRVLLGKITSGAICPKRVVILLDEHIQGRGEIKEMSCLLSFQDTRNDTEIRNDVFFLMV